MITTCIAGTFILIAGTFTLIADDLAYTFKAEFLLWDSRHI